MLGFKNRIFTLVALTLTLTVVFLTAFYSFAWLAQKLSSGNIGFTAGVLDDCTLHIAKVIHDGNTTPEESSREYFPCEGSVIEGESVPTQNGDYYTVSLEKLSFGIIDNIALPKPENVVYLRFTVPKESGKNVKLRLYYDYEDDYFAEMYKNEYEDDGETVRAQKKITDDDTLSNGVKILENFHAVESEEMANDCYLKYSVAVSNDSVDADKLCNMQFYGTDGQLATLDTNNHYRLNTDISATLTHDDIESAGEFFYVYIKVEPNLSVFAHSIEFIAEIMPCYVYFRVNADFEIY